jgi:hypothetical protein
VFHRFHVIAGIFIIDGIQNYPEKDESPLPVTKARTKNRKKEKSPS